MSNVDYRVRDSDEWSAAERMACDIGRLHAELLAHSPLVLMGQEFVEEFYYRILPREGFIRCSVAYVNDVPAGFIVATPYANGFMSEAMKRHWLRISWIMFRSVMRDPRRALAIKEAYQIQSHVAAEQYGPEVGELLSFGVLPEYRSRKFVKESSIRIGADLLRHAVENLAATGTRTIRAIVDKDNLEAQFFYRSHGWRVGLAEVKGWRVPTMEFLFDCAAPSEHSE